VSDQTGPIYGAPIPTEPMPVGVGMLQAVASRRDLECVLKSKAQGAMRVVAAYEVMAAQLAALTAERDTYKKALHGISLGSQNSMTSKDDLGREAPAAIDAAKGGAR
jgi:hypothetical protein